jgi:hypothetical protein
MSEFVWLDYSERERRKMLDIVDLFREHDTRDELGIGSVRDTFADLIFPGTSTIMTRARYFLLVQHPEKSRIVYCKSSNRNDGTEHKNTDWFQIQIWGPVAKFAATLKAGTPVIVEVKIKPETYTADGVEHKTFSIKADYIRKIDYSAPSEVRESKAAKSAKKKAK